MARIFNFAVAALVLLHSTNASMNPLMLSKTAMLKSIRKTSHTRDFASSIPRQSYATSIDEWYEDGCDELLQASNTHVDENEVTLCSVSEIELAMLNDAFIHSFFNYVLLICHTMKFEILPNVSTKLNHNAGCCSSIPN
jgi:hypothetical protein